MIINFDELNQIAEKVRGFNSVTRVDVFPTGEGSVVCFCTNLSFVYHKLNLSHVTECCSFYGYAILDNCGNVDCSTQHHRNYRSTTVGENAYECYISTDHDRYFTALDYRNKAVDITDEVNFLQPSDNIYGCFGFMVSSHIIYGYKRVAFSKYPVAIINGAMVDSNKVMAYVNHLPVMVTKPNGSYFETLISDMVYLFCDDFVIVSMNGITENALPHDFFCGKQPDHIYTKNELKQKMSIVEIDKMGDIIESYKMDDHIVITDRKYAIIMRSIKCW